MEDTEGINTPNSLFLSSGPTPSGGSGWHLCPFVPVSGAERSGEGGQWFHGAKRTCQLLSHG